MKLVFFVKVGFEIHFRDDAGPQPSKLEVNAGQKSLASQRQVPRRRMDFAPPDLLHRKKYII